jgi:hypothetical protein
MFSTASLSCAIRSIFFEETGRSGRRKFAIWYTLQEFDAPYFAFQMSDEVFNLSLHTMTMCLHSKKNDMVHLTPSLEFLLVDELLLIITSD